MESVSTMSENNNSSSSKSSTGNKSSKYEGAYQVDVSETGFDLETITLSYTGLLRIFRLLYVAEHCPALRSEALLTSLHYLKETSATNVYKQVLQEIKKENIELPADFDESWLERTQRGYVQKLEKLDTDLRNFRTNSIKDSIRRGNDDLGDHYLGAGDFHSAVRCYVSSRDYCVSPRHVITMCMNVIKASFFMQNWTNVLSYVTKAEQALESLETTTKSAAAPSATTSSSSSADLSEAEIASRLKVYAGIAELATGRYKLAARHFLAVSFDHCANKFQDLISPQTLIRYVCLCSLATLERSEVHRLIIMSSNMKQYLELEPAIRDIILDFYQTSYSSVLTNMSRQEPVFALDQYLARHLSSLYDEIRHRIIITYFLPYKNADMNAMAMKLNTTVNVLEDELVHLIRLEKIKARIDSKNKILYVADTDQRWHAYQHALNVTKRSEKITAALLLRSAIMKANLVVRDASASTAGRPSKMKGKSRGHFVPGYPSNMMIMDDNEFYEDETM
ncbi:unnamed protein product [Adineta ricciae]|uniref:PCI domain-containing protein n=1 Tax=Adineta ricciae TaxID=249248 RepID=A0A814YJV9_ADIRI|nr:unnamed protein product [Adineta ricciae]CAF1274333.1 unnamed protein product [Adineta ricciae]